jgi:Asp-tRNA(Asn)/Glu-tRNA(Gln) amidotransferase C subunit
VSDELFDAQQREEMESSALTGRQKAFVDTIVQIDLLEAMLAIWRHNAKLHRAVDMGSSQPFFPKGMFWGFPKHVVELAIADLFTFFHMGKPFDTELSNAEFEARRQADDARQNAETIEVAHRMAIAHLHAAKAAQQQFQAGQLESVIAHIDRMLEIDVTHSERRGQLKLLQEVIRKMRNDCFMDVSDIPF